MYFNIREVPASGGSPEFWEILFLSVRFPTPEKMTRVRRAYQEQSGSGLIEASMAGGVVGALGYQEVPSGVELKHVAVLPDRRLQGVARALIFAVTKKFPNRVVFAETDSGAVDFYRRLGFKAEALPQKPDWNARWSCRLDPGRGAPESGIMIDAGAMSALGRKRTLALSSGNLEFGSGMRGI